MKRFYKEVSLDPSDGGVALHLDGRAVKSPAGNAVVVPVGRFADALAREWEAQGEEIDPTIMPLTRLSNSVIDGVATRRDEVASDIIAYGASDLVCYLAEHPEDLIARQEAHWRPVHDWAAHHLGASFKCGRDIAAVAQDDNALVELANDVNKLDDFGLAALHEMTSLTGSVLISLAVVRGGLEPNAAWDAAHVDEAFQAEKWGEDEEARARFDARHASFDNAVRALTLLGILAD